MRVLMQERVAAGWKQLRISHIYSGATLHAPFDEFRGIDPRARFCDPSSFAITSVLYDLLLCRESLKLSGRYH